MGRLKAKPHLGAIQRAAHGGLDYAEMARLGLAPADVLDFSVNTNPAPIPEGLRRTIASADVTTYPDDGCLALREAAAAAFGVAPEQVLAGNGSSELIWLVALAYISLGDTVLVRQPTFGEYQRAARIHGAEVAGYGDGLEHAFASIRPRVAFVCNPNNPTGDLADPTMLLAMARQHPKVLVVVDEAYADFVDGRPTAIGPEMPENVVVLRSLTKFSALAGLRLGLAFGQPRVIQALRAVKPPWNVNAAAQAAGEYALRHPELLPDLAWLAHARRELMAGLQALGLRTLPTACNFFLVQTPNARALRDRLRAKGCLVRDCASFGLADHLRVAVRTEADNARLLEVMAAVL